MYEWERERERRRREEAEKGLKEDKKEDLCVGDGGLEKNSERLIGF